MAKSGRIPDESALHSMHIGGATRLAGGGDTSVRDVERQERGKSDAYKAYMRNSIVEGVT